MGLSKKVLKRVFSRAIRGIKTKGVDETMRDYVKERGELDKIGSEMIPKRITEIREIHEIHKGPLQIQADRIELPLKTVPIIVRENQSEMQNVSKKGTQREIQKAVKEFPEQESVKVNEMPFENSNENQTPIFFEFPKIGEELKSRGVIRLQEIEETGEVRGIPMSAHVLPKEAMKKIATEWEPPSLEQINVKYPLIDPYAYASIKWDDDSEALSYTVIEPPLTKKEKITLDKIRNLLIDLLDINLSDIKNITEVQNYLKEKMDQIIMDYEINVTDVEYNKVLYYIYRNFLGLEEIEPIMQDLEIEDISCDGANVPIFIFHRKYGSLKTNVLFTDQDELNKFITKLAQRCGKHISVAEPLLDGALPDGSRLQATFSAGGDIAMRGSTFTIRKFTKDPLTIIDFMNFGTIPSLIGAYLWMAIEYRNSILVSGGTATGKTSSLNALSLFLPPEVKIVSIEDTPELRLTHEHWIAKVARSGYGPEEEGRRKGEISMFDLLKAALRERPDELIVGEVRGAEAYVLFQGMATGHSGLATIHAESMEGVVNRLTTKPINLSAGLLQHLDIVIIMGFSRIKGIDVRRIKEVIEIVGVDEKSGKPITNQIFRWIPAGDYFEFASDRSYVLNQIIEEKGIPEKSIWEEIQRRVSILEWMKKQNIRFYKDVGRIIATYYKNPEQILEKIK